MQTQRGNLSYILVEAVDALLDRDNLVQRNEDQSRTRNSRRRHTSERKEEDSSTA